MRKKMLVPLFACLFLAAVAPLSAAVSEPTVSRTGKAEKELTVYPMGKLLGSEVRGAAGEILGDLRHLLVDMKDGRVVFAVVAAGGALGVGERMHTVPWKMLKKEGESFVLPVTREKMAAEPIRRPGLNDAEYSREIHRFYGISRTGPAERETRR